MTTDTLVNEARSAATSSNRPLAPEPKSEAEVLSQEIDAAKAAIAQSIKDLTHDLKATADVRYWTKQHPWLAVGLAAGAGFAAAAGVFVGADDAGPTDNNGRNEEPTAASQSPPASQASFARSAVWSWLLLPLMEMLKVSAEKFLHNALNGGLDLSILGGAPRRSAETAAAAAATPSDDAGAVEGAGGPRDL